MRIGKEIKVRFHVSPDAYGLMLDIPSWSLKNDKERQKKDGSCIQERTEANVEERIIQEVPESAWVKMISDEEQRSFIEL